MIKERNVYEILFVTIAPIIYDCCNLIRVAISPFAALDSIANFQICASRQNWSKQLIFFSKTFLRNYSSEDPALSFYLQLAETDTSKFIFFRIALKNYGGGSLKNLQRPLFILSSE